MTLLISICAQSAFSQFVQIPLPRNQTKSKQIASGRTQELAPMPLPFWDDFSFSNLPFFPHDTLWQFGQSVWVNKGEGINPPSLGVATFDGLDSLGKPYNVNDALAKGIADRLTSRPLTLNLVDPLDRNSVYLSFYYQFRGNGEPPDPGDQLRVLFKNETGSWVLVKTIENDGSFDPSVFTQVLVQVTGDEYFHENFQFSIQNFGRLSGPYDTWNIDYIYLNKGRTADDTSYPDRTITLPLTSMFNGYYSMPLDHFLVNPAANLKPPMLAMHNLEFIPGNTDQSDVQPINYDSEDSVLVYRNNTKTVYTHTLDNATSIGNPLQPLEFRQTGIQTLPVLSNLSPLDSAAQIKLKLWINSGDNVVPTMANPLGDYNVAKYAPIDFRSNDTTHVEYTLADYYAYDDGGAEYGAALNQPGAQLAYLFEMKTPKPDTIVALDLYFPQFGEDNSEAIQIQILSNLTGDPGSFLHIETVTIVRNGQNKFWRFVPNRLVGVKEKFYVGWKQSSANVVAVGLDKNTDSGDKIFYNLNGEWEQNTNLVGSLMVRPVFGKGEGVVTGLPVDEVEHIKFFPNPNSGTFTVQGKIDQIQVYDLTGRAVPFSTEKTQEGEKVNLVNPSRGLYILRIFSGETLSTHRIKVE